MLNDGSRRSRAHVRPWLTVIVLLAAAAGCDRPPATVGTAGANRESSSSSVPSIASETNPPWFTEIAALSGLDFLHSTGATGEYYFPEIAGSGCGLFDYDNDSDLDVYAIQSFPLAWVAANPGQWKAATADGVGMNRLYRNDLTIDSDGTRHVRFVDVTEEAGVGDRGYGMGCAAGDYDNDGDVDLYVTNFGPNVLYRNNGDGTFTDVSAAAIPPEDRWSTSASFFDYDRDGSLDLFVVNYVNFGVAENKRCRHASGRHDYCGPASFDDLTNRLFRNNGDGTFADVTGQAGIDRAGGSGLGVVCADFNGDAWPDVYVANDGDANLLFINNRGDGTFEETGLFSGSAYNINGQAESGMGVTAADFDEDGDEDLFITHLRNETNTVYVNDGRAQFEDRTAEIMGGVVSLPFTGFGTEWFDADGDGLLDLFIANGAVTIEDAQAGEPYPYRNPNQLLLNAGSPRFGYRDISQQGGPAVQVSEASRGAAFGDIDNDGDMDILVSNSNGPLRLLRNDAGNRRWWLVLKLEGTQSNRDAVGALVRLERAGRPPLMRRVHADGSYCSINDLRVFFGVDEKGAPQSVSVTWPGGRVERFTGLEPGGVITLVEGTGEPAR